MKTLFSTRELIQLLLFHFFGYRAGLYLDFRYILPLIIIHRNEEKNCEKASIYHGLREKKIIESCRGVWRNDILLVYLLRISLFTILFWEYRVFRRSKPSNRFGNLKKELIRYYSNQNLSRFQIEKTGSLTARLNWLLSICARPNRLLTRT